MDRARDLVFERCRGDEIPPDEEDVFGWGTDLFGVQAYELQWATPEWRFLMRIDSNPVVHIAVLGRTVTVVATLALNHAARFVANELGLAFAMGFCVDHMVPFYRERGWQQVDARVMIEQPTGNRLSPCICLVLPCGARE